MGAKVPDPLPLHPVEELEKGRELQKRGRSDLSPQLRYRILRAVFLVKTAMWTAALLVLAVLAKLGGVGG